MVHWMRIYGNSIYNYTQNPTEFILIHFKTFSWLTSNIFRQVFFNYMYGVKVEVEAQKVEELRMVNSCYMLNIEKKRLFRKNINSILINFLTWTVIYLFNEENRINYIKFEILTWIKKNTNNLHMNRMDRHSDIDYMIHL